MLHRPLIAAAMICLTALPVRAEVRAETQALYDALNLGEMLNIMHEEGLGYGADIAEDLFGNRSNPSWDEQVAAIYDVAGMEAAVLASLDAATEGDDIAGMLAFLTSDTGQEIIELEVAARRAFLDDDVEEASVEAAALAMADETPRFALVERFVDANDLIETNVVGAMNSNYAFFLGLTEGGGFPQEMTEDQILADVWGQEPEIRRNTTEWVFSFVMLAFQPLDDAQIETYITFSESDAGQDLNSALFLTFDPLFEGISRDLGRAASVFMIGQDL